MYAEWTKEILKAYEEYEDKLEKGTREYIEYCGYEPLGISTLERLCRYWWIGLCAVGCSGILHPYNREQVNLDDIEEIAITAHLDPKITALAILHEDTLVKEYETSGTVNGTSVYIEPLAALYDMLTDAPDNLNYKIPSEEIFTYIGEIGMKAIEIGDRSWKKVVYGTVDNWVKKYNKR